MPKHLSNTSKINTHTHTHQAQHQTQAHFHSMGKGLGTATFEWGINLVHSGIANHGLQLYKRAFTWTTWFQHCKMLKKTFFKWCKFTTPRQQKHMCHTEGLGAMATHCEIATCSLLGCKKCEFLHWTNQIHTKRHPPKHRIWHQLVFGEPTLANFFGMHKGNWHITSWHACKTQCQHHLATRNDRKCWNM